MRLRRNSKKSANPIVPTSSEAGGPLDHALKQPVPETAQIKKVIDRQNQQKDLGFRTATVVQREGCDQP